MFNVISRVVFGDSSAAKIHHFYSEKLSHFNLCRRRYLRMPPVVKWKFLLPWLLLQIYRHHYSWTITRITHILLLLLPPFFFYVFDSGTETVQLQGNGDFFLGMMWTLSTCVSRFLSNRSNLIKAYYKIYVVV